MNQIQEEDQQYQQARPPKKRYLKLLTDAQQRFCEAYLIANRDYKETARILGLTELTSKQRASKFCRMLKAKAVRKYLSKRIDNRSRSLRLNFDNKTKKLAKVVEEFIPENSETQMDPKKVSVAITAIQELNKMSGDYAAEKRVNINVEPSDKEKEIANSLIEQFKKPY